MSHKKILIVTSEFPPLPGGIGNHAHQLAYHLQGLGHEVSVLADHRTFGQDEENQFDVAQPYNIQRIARKKNRWYMYTERIRLYRQLLSKTEVVIASGKFPLWLVGFTSLGYPKTPKLAVLHGSEVNFKKWWLKKSVNLALMRFDQAIAVSGFTSQLVNHLPLKVKIIPNGIQLAQWQGGEHFGRPEKAAYPILITVGNLTERKGQANVIKLLPHLLKQYPNIRYDCIGLPTEIEKLEQLAKMLGVAERVTFYGRVPQQEVRQKLIDSDVFMMLSNQTESGDVEGFGIAILEANAMGIPAIGAKGSGIEDAILEGQSGFLVEKENQDAITGALEKILANKEAYRTGAFQWAQQHDWKHLEKQYQEVIEELLAKR